MQILGAETADNPEDFAALKTAAEVVNSLLNDEDESADPAEVAEHRTAVRLAHCTVS